MNRTVFIAAVLSPFCANAAIACDIAWGTGPRPTWHEMVGRSEIVFIGRVISVSPETERGFGRAEFEVHKWIKGGSDPLFVAAQGSGSNCVAEFSVGSRVIFAGNWTLSPSSDQRIAIAEDTGWDALVYLDNPPTAAQRTFLSYLDGLAPKRAK